MNTTTPDVADRPIRAGRAAALLVASLAAAVAAPCPAAEEATIDPPEVLSDNDIGHAKDMATPGRWSKAVTEEGRTFRTYTGPRSLSYVGIKPWFKGGEKSPAEVIVCVTYEDTTVRPVTVLAWSGTGRTYGYGPIGWIGGANDRKWKQALLICPKGMFRLRPKAKPANVCWMLFNGGGQVSVDRIRVLKAGEALKGRAVHDARDARATSVKALAKAFQRVPRKEKEPPLGPVGEEAKRLGFVPFARNYTLDIHPDTIPPAAERRAGPLRTYATPGEFEPLQVGARVLRDVTISAEVSDLTGPGTLKAGQHVKVYWIEALPMRVGSSWGKRCQEMGVWMRPAEPVHVKAGTTQAWYVVIAVPPDARPGSYTGRLTLSRGGDAQAHWPVELRVLGFKLDKADHVARGPYVGRILDDEYIRDLTDHGINSMSLWPTSEFAPRLQAGKCALKVSERMDGYLRKLKAAGIVRMVHFGGGDPAAGNPAGLAGETKTKVGSGEFEKYYGQWWLDIRRQEKQRGWPEMICCPFDEPVKSAGKTRNYLACYEAVKKVSPATKVFCVFMNRPGACKQLGPKADIWSCNGAFEANSAEKRRLAGQGVHKLFYTYTGAMGCTRPGGARYNAGILPWHYGADGTYFWAYLWYGGDPFNDLDAGHRDWSPVARDVDGKVYTTVGWEGHREGIDDLRYIHTCIRMAREKGRKDVLEKIAALQADVRKGKESAESRRTRGLDDFFIKIDDATFLDVYRAKVAGMILEMLGAKP